MKKRKGIVIPVSRLLPSMLIDWDNKYGVETHIEWCYCMMYEMNLKDDDAYVRAETREDGVQWCCVERIRKSKKQ
jgi:hypothetical protein